MPAKSKQQQKFMGIVRAIQKGDVPASKFSKKARDAAKDMKGKDVEKYASTKHKGLPKKVSEINEQIPRHFRGYFSNVNDNMDRLDKNLKLLIKDLGKDGLRKEALALASLYKKHIVEFKVKFSQLNKQLSEAPEDYVDKNADDPIKLLRRKQKYDQYDGRNGATEAKESKIYKESKDPDIIAKVRDVVKQKQNKVIKDPKTGKNMRMDGYSANAIVKVYDALNTTNKKKFAKLGLKQMSAVAFKFV